MWKCHVLGSATGNTHCYDHLGTTNWVTGGAGTSEMSENSTLRARTVPLVLSASGTEVLNIIIKTSLSRIEF